MKKIKYFLVILLFTKFIQAFAVDYSSDDSNIRISLPIFVNYKSDIINNEKHNIDVIQIYEQFNDKNIRVNIYKPLIKMKNSKVEEKINLQINKVIEEFKEKIYIEAKKNNQYNMENKLPLKQFEVMVSNKINYNKENILSLTLDLYSYLGGAHGTTEKISLNINANTGNIGNLEDFLGRNEEYNEIILKEVKSEISKNPDMYFQNEVEKIIISSDSEKFFIEENYVVIYFDEYEIAPYVAGSPEFKIHLDKFPEGLNNMHT